MPCTLQPALGGHRSPPRAASQLRQVRNVEDKQKKPKVNILWLGVVVIGAVFFLADSFEERGSQQTMLILGAAVVIVGAVFGYLALEKKERLKTLEKLRLGAVVIDGVTPLYMTLPEATTEKERRKAKATAKPATLAVTPDAVELWASKDSPQLVRSIPNTQNVTISTEVVNFGKMKGEFGTTSIDYEAIIITDRDGTDIIIRPNKLTEALREVEAALN